MVACRPAWEACLHGKHVSGMGSQSCWVAWHMGWLSSRALFLQWRAVREALLLERVAYGKVTYQMGSLFLLWRGLREACSQYEKTVLLLEGAAYRKISLLLEKDLLLHKKRIFSLNKNVREEHQEHHQIRGVKGLNVGAVLDHLTYSN